jgi:hypothetical protein
MFEKPKWNALNVFVKNNIRGSTKETILAMGINAIQDLEISHDNYFFAS